MLPENIAARLDRLSMPEPMSGCWLWLGCTTKPRGEIAYGRINVGGHRSNINILAHVAAYRLAHGAIPKGMCVCHRCDNPLCVNPDHLELGTWGKNNRDQSLRLRHPSKLTEPEAQEIRRRFAAGETKGTLAREFRVDEKTIYNAVHKRCIYRASWRPRPERQGSRAA